MIKQFSKQKISQICLAKNTVENIVKSKVFKTFLEMIYNSLRVFETFVAQTTRETLDV